MVYERVKHTTYENAVLTTLLDGRLSAAVVMCYTEKISAVETVQDGF